MPKFRMIHVDHYMCRPIVPFDDLKSEITGKSISKVPIIRIFGADSEGRKICIHVHGFYPYVAVQNKDPDDPTLGRRIVADIEKAVSELADKNRRDKRQPQPAEPRPAADQDADSNSGQRAAPAERRPWDGLSADQRHPVHKIEPVTSHNYYGYHEKPEGFFKLHLYNPKMVKQLAAVFEDCRVLGRFVPVFWAHLPYILLFFIDNNLRGMQFIEVDKLYWRKDKAPVKRRGSQSSRFSDDPRAGTSRDDPNQDRIDNAMIEDAELYTTDEEAISSCELEADVRCEWIVNGRRFGSKGNDDALRELWLDDQEASQATSLVDSKLPLFELERSYIRQLCDSYGVDEQALELEVTERERPLQLSTSGPGFSDSDESLDALLERDDKSVTPERTLVVESKPDRAAGPSKIKQEGSSYACEDDEFSDDEEFLRNVPKIEAALRSQKLERIQYQTKTEPTSHPTLKAEIKTESQSYVEQGATASNPGILKVELATVHQTPSADIGSNEDEFSDDDEFLRNVMKIEASMKNPGYTDNSIIDGKSILNSSAKTKSSSQHSISSSKESVSHEYQYVSLMSMELHISTRGKLRPNPQFDPIEAVFYCIRNDTPDTSSKTSQVIGMIITDPFKDKQRIASPTQIEDSFKSPGTKSNMSYAHKLRSLIHKTGLSLRDIELNLVETELELIMALVEVVRLYDPEILLGYEMEQLSWGYVLERSTQLNLNVSTALSRVTDPNLGNNSKYVESTFVQPIMFTGRMVFSTWRIIRHDINLNTCSYERIHHHALNERVPCFSFETLTSWFNQNRNRWRVIDYYLTRIVGQMRILDKFDLIAKVSELARVYGTQFIDVITRGSQIGIESMMLRLAKLQNLTPLSPTVSQRNKMKAPEALPLVMEPETNIYYDPVAVLDFQSLYPSIVIAYNYCYSTCLGRVSDLETKERHNFGCSQLHVPEEEVKRLLSSNSIHISPCGAAYVKKNVRHGVLPKMLSELIMTRAMVKDQMKKNMKSDRPNRRLQRILNHRQHGLKMMANTTYGYTGASYTGRMPCVEIADSIVSKGRETLENAIELVESREEWGAKVIYGDTDSIFIQFKNCDKDTAFKRAYEMVDAITQTNPYPIKMKFEKIYQPCVLQTKKRYCGFKYESPEQAKPEFEAKGIETVRRDCCPAAARMLEMALRIQFTSRDINQVKKYVQHQFVKIMSGKLSNIQDFIFARQYKPRDLEKTESVFVPAWQITKRLLASDPRAEPRFNQRVPFVIIYGEPKTPLVNLAKTPLEVLENLSYRINSDYYIQKIICPTLNRIFCTMKVDTLLWYKSMPHQNIIHRSHYLVAQQTQHNIGAMSKQSTMSQYFSPSHCPVCAKSIPISDDICDDCRGNLQSSVVRLTEEITRNQRKLFAYHQLCRACASLERCNGDEATGAGDQHLNPCISYDCQNLFRYHQAKLDALNSNFLSQILKSLN